MNNTITKLPTGPGAILSGPTNQKYHDQTTLTRCLAVASAGKKLWAALQRVPHFFPAEWPIGVIILYAALIAGGIYTGFILWLLTSLSGNQLLAIATPALIAGLEFILVPVIKYGSLRDKQVAAMKAFVAEDRAARDAATHAASAWGWRDYLVLLILLICFAAKAMVLLNFGTYQPTALLATNWTIACLDFCFHLGGLTTRVPCFIGSRLSDWFHLRKRRSDGYKVMGSDGKPELGALAFREFPFTTAMEVRTGEVNGHLLVHIGSDKSGHHYVLYSPGTLDDADRASFLNCQPNHLAQTELARALARVQLEQLTQPEMRSLNSADPLASGAPAKLPTSASIPNPIAATVTCVLAAVMLQACVDRSALSNSADKANEPNIVITQPGAPEAIMPVVDTLRQSFVRTAEANGGASVPNPNISILLPDGKTVTIPPPNIDGGFFGSSSPKARQTRIERHLKALKDKLTAGCSGQSVTAKVVKDHHTNLFKAGNFTVWAAGGGDNPWNATESGPMTFLDDRTVFAVALGNSQGKGGNFLILSEATDNRIAKAESQKSTDHGAPTTSEEGPLPNPNADPAAATQPDAAQAVTPRTGDTIIVDVKNYPATNRSDNSSSTSKADRPKLSISLPQGVIALGDAIRFATNSAKLTSEGSAAVKRAANLLKQRSDAGRVRLFLVAKADYRSGENHNERLSQMRAETVQAALLTEGISVERIIAVGESLSPDDSPETELARQRTVQLWILPERVTNHTAPAIPLAQTSR